MNTDSRPWQNDPDFGELARLGIAPCLQCPVDFLTVGRLFSGAAMPVKGAADMLADARAAVRNSASRRVIGPVICVLKMRPLALPRDTTLPALQQAGTACQCPAQGEKLAYEAQDHWLHLFGRNLEAEFEINGLALLVSTSCAWQWACTSPQRSG